MSEPEETAERPLLYLEDLEVGQRFLTARHALDEAQILAFARAFDPQPFHLDGAAAKGTLFGGLAASGWHTASIMMRLLVTSGPRLAGGVIGVDIELAWPRPTRPGDVLQVECEVLEVTPSRKRADRGSVRMRMTTRNQNTEVVQIMTGSLVVQRRTEAGA